MNNNRSEYRVLVVGDFWHGSLEESYARAFELEGTRVKRFTLSAAVHRYTRLGRIGKLLNTFYPMEAWINKANRELVLAAMDFRPNLIVVGGPGPVRVGSLAQIRALSPETRLVLLWPDTLLRILPHVPACLPLYDLVASYARSAVEPFQQLGARRVLWVPLGADQELHPADVMTTEKDRRVFSCDVAFIGNHRPEREKLILALVNAGISVKVWGPDDWRRHARSRSEVARYWQGHSLYGEDFAKAMRGAKLSLNPIDPTNYPAANMRFFEVPACRGMALNSSCPEMESIFVQGESAYYYHAEDELVSMVRKLLANPMDLLRVADAAHLKVVESHTYVHRARQILQEIAN